MLGWSAVAGVVDWSVVTPMYFGGIAWGIMYDLIYAHQVCPRPLLPLCSVPKLILVVG